MAGLLDDYVAIQDDETARRILHMPGIVAYIENKADECNAATGSSNFETVVFTTPGWFRPAAYVMPANDDGIREELADAVLLKAALGMAGR